MRSNTPAATLRKEVPGNGVRSLDCELQSGSARTGSFSSRDTCRGCNKQRDAKNDEYTNGWSQTAAWLQQGGGSSGDAARLVNKPQGAPLALTRQQLAQAKAAASPDECVHILESKVQQEEAAMKQAQPLGQKMDQAQARFRRPVESGE